MKEELIKRLEVRKEQLLGEIDLGYEVHQGHHLRDIFTVLSYLKGHPDAEKMINNLPRLSVQTAKSGGES